MAYNNPFPVGYNPYYPYQPPASMQYQQQPTAPQYQQIQGAQMSGANQQPQAMTYPTIHADIVQTDDESVIDRWGVTQDRPQMFINHAETVITIKSVSGNGVVTDYYDKRPPAPPEQPFNPAEYVRRDELPDLVAAAVAAVQTPTAAKTARAKKEAANDEPV